MKISTDIVFLFRWVRTLGVVASPRALVEMEAMEDTQGPGLKIELHIAMIRVRQVVTRAQLALEVEEVGSLTDFKTTV